MCTEQVCHLGEDAREQAGIDIGLLWLRSVAVQKATDNVEEYLSSAAIHSLEMSAVVEIELER